MFEEMMDRIAEKCAISVEKRLKRWLENAYATGYAAGRDVGYEVGGEDATRRMHDMYNIGKKDGRAEAEAEAGVIEVDGLDLIAELGLNEEVPECEY